MSSRGKPESTTRNRTSRTGKPYWVFEKRCVTGMAELTECARAENPWLLQVQQEMRAGDFFGGLVEFRSRARDERPRGLGGRTTQLRQRKMQQDLGDNKTECDVCQGERES